MKYPEFDNEGCPTDKTLETIKHWPIPRDVSWAELIAYCRAAWNMDFGDVRVHETVGRSKVVSFITGGWSDNEAILSAMADNRLFYTCCWHSSERGGLVRFLAPSVS